MEPRECYGYADAATVEPDAHYFHPKVMWVENVGSGFHLTVSTGWQGGYSQRYKFDIGDVPGYYYCLAYNGPSLFQSSRVFQQTWTKGPQGCGIAAWSNAKRAASPEIKHC